MQSGAGTKGCFKNAASIELQPLIKQANTNIGQILFCLRKMSTLIFQGRSSESGNIAFDILGSSFYGNKGKRRFVGSANWTNKFAHMIGCWFPSKTQKMTKNVIHDIKLVNYNRFKDATFDSINDNVKVGHLHSPWPGLGRKFFDQFERSQTSLVVAQWQFSWFMNRD